jgi:hypothetical protein
LGAAAVHAREEYSLNGDTWTFQPMRRAFYGYELDAPGRWKPSQRSHRFIIEALSDPAIDWERRHPVRVPMSWSCALSEPGSREAAGDFPFPPFWQYVHIGAYERSFAVPASFAGRRVRLAFESVNFRCWVYVNGTLVHRVGEVRERGDWTHENRHPFEVDITDCVRAPSGNNRLRVVVHDFTASFAGPFPNEDQPVGGCDYPLGDRCDYYNKDRGWRNLDNGILGDVTLAAVSEVHAVDVVVRTSVAASSIEADATVRNEGRAPRTVRVTARVEEANGGRTVFIFDEKPGLTLAPGEARPAVLRQAWPAPRLWWPHDPFLHRLIVELRDAGGRVVSSHSERFGFREVRLVASPDADTRGFYLNGVRVRLFGESVEPTWKDGYTEGVGTSGPYLYNPEYWSFMVDEAKRLNMTVLRPHRGQWLRRLFEIADEKGMLMIAESTINNGNHQGGLGTVENQRRAVRDLIRALRNHPSVVLWSLANESPWNEAWADEARLHDRTRPYVATQTTPRNHPSPTLAAATGSYAMGLSGYQPDIYGRHDANWVEKPMYIYEDNACYDQPTDAERLRTVQQGLTILRGHRGSGYEIVCTFYTWQKLYGQPQIASERLLRISWSDAEASGRGYHPAQARMPLFDPWTDRTRPRVLRPLSGFADDPDAFWRRSLSPVAVFDRAHDQRHDVAANPYVAPLDAARTLLLHNDDLEDRSTQLRVTWTVRAEDTAAVISEGACEAEVPLGGVRPRDIRLDLAGREAVRVTYRAFKSGRERFAETIRLSTHATAAAAALAATAAAAQENTVRGSEAGPAARAAQRAETVPSPLFAAAGATSHGYRRAVVPGQAGAAVLVADPAAPDAFVDFHPEVPQAGRYHLFVHVPPGLTGTQGIEIRHDTTNTTLHLDLANSGWVQATASPVVMQPGALQNVVRFLRGGTATRSVVDAIRLVPAGTP